MHTNNSAPELEDITAADSWAREQVRNLAGGEA